MKYWQFNSGEIFMDPEAGTDLWFYSLENGRLDACPRDCFAVLAASDAPQETTAEAFAAHIAESEARLSALFEDARRLARAAHAGQTDKAGKDYFTGHCEKVAGIATRLYGKGYAAIAGLLHDTIEDTDVTAGELAARFPREVAEAVETVSHREGESYSDFILRIKQNPLAVKVKICDLINNMDLRRIPCPAERDFTRIQKYAVSLAELMRESSACSGC